MGAYLGEAAGRVEAVEEAGGLRGQVEEVLLHQRVVE